MLHSQGCTISQARIWHCKGSTVFSGDVWQVSVVKDTNQTAQQLMTASALAVRWCVCSKARPIRSNKNKSEMLEQKSEILSHYHSLDCSFVSKRSPVLVSRKRSTLATSPPNHYIRLWFLGDTNPIDVVHRESQHCLEISSGGPTFLDAGAVPCCL